MLISLGSSSFVNNTQQGPTKDYIQQQQQAEMQLQLQQQNAQMQLQLQQQQAQMQMQQQQQLQATMFGQQQNPMVMSNQGAAVDPALMLQAMLMSHMAMNQPMTQPMLPQGQQMVDQYAMPPSMMNNNINTFQGNNFQANLLPPPLRDDYQGLTQQEIDRLPRNANDKEYPIKILCSNCKKVVTTSCDRKWGSGTYICCVVTSFAGMCFLPYFIDDCKDRVHHCPQCHSEVGLKPFKCCLCC